MTEQPAAGEGQLADGASTPPVRIVPEWLENLAALGWRVFVIAALAVVLWFLASVLWVVTASILVAIVIAAFFAPIRPSTPCARSLPDRGGGDRVGGGARHRGRRAAAPRAGHAPLPRRVGARPRHRRATAPGRSRRPEHPAGGRDGRPRPGRRHARRDRGVHWPDRRQRGGRGDGGHPRRLPGVLLPARRRQGVDLDLPGRERPEARADHGRR